MTRILSLDFITRRADRQLPCFNVFEDVLKWVSSFISAYEAVFVDNESLARYTEEDPNHLYASRIELHLRGLLDMGGPHLNEHKESKGLPLSVNELMKNITRDQLKRYESGLYHCQVRGLPLCMSEKQCEYIFNIFPKISNPHATSPHPEDIQKEKEAASRMHDIWKTKVHQTLGEGKLPDLIIGKSVRSDASC